MKTKTKTELLRIARDTGAVFGTGNSKVGTWSTYRPVGPTCPTRCAFHPDHYSDETSPCYATKGRVAMAQRRAQTDVGSAVAGFAACLELSARERGGTPYVRLRTSGDMFTDGRIDRQLVDTEARIAKRHGGAWGTWVAWGYTHADPTSPEAQKAVRRYREAGVAMRWSGRRGRWGAIVLPLDPDATRADFRAAARKVGALPCPAQLGDTTCARCRACSDRPERTIAFRPDGSTSKGVGRAARAARLRVL